MIIDALAASGAFFMMFSKIVEHDVIEAIVWGCITLWAGITFLDRRLDDR
jgi:hypothetical protein